MHIGVFIGTQHEPTTDPRDAMEGHIEQAALLAKHGFDSLWLGQHLLTHPNQFFQPTPLLARLAAETGEMQLGTNLLLLPLFNPVDVAEQYATLDYITGGRLILGIGLGYRDEEYTAFGVERRTRARRFEEGIELVKRLWTADELFTHHGEFFTVEDSALSLKPLQRPHPPIWIGATADPAIRRAALQADAWIATSLTVWNEVKRQLDLYRSIREDHGLPQPDAIAKCVEVYVGESREQAMAEAEPHILSKYSAYYAWGMGGNVPGDSGQGRSFADMVESRFIVGDPEDCAEGILHHRDELDITHLLVRFNFPTMSRTEVRKQIELFGTEVLPQVRS